VPQVLPEPLAPRQPNLEDVLHLRHGLERHVHIWRSRKFSRFLAIGQQTLFDPSAGRASSLPALVCLVASSPVVEVRRDLLLHRRQWSG
jgi:hypothetical protein